MCLLEIDLILFSHDCSCRQVIALGGGEELEEKKDTGQRFLWVTTDSKTVHFMTSLNNTMQIFKKFKKKNC